ncbi:MAG: keto-deoxy-phosphogluconate aldolase, partial [Sulfuricurvum sp.]|nr:keto-deoxy-phosphogluconate aldolase [Sulfuricurvum sp.]
MGISPIVPVIALERAEDALPLADALMEGGIFIMEIT